MKTKKLTPRNAAPVKRKNVATVNQGDAIAQSSYVHPSFTGQHEYFGRFNPFAGDDAE